VRQQHHILPHTSQRPSHPHMRNIGDSATTVQHSNSSMLKQQCKAVGSHTVHTAVHTAVSTPQASSSTHRALAGRPILKQHHRLMSSGRCKLMPLAQHAGSQRDMQWGCLKAPCTVIVVSHISSWPHGVVNSCCRTIPFCSTGLRKARSRQLPAKAASKKERGESDAEWSSPLCVMVGSRIVGGRCPPPHVHPHAP
jgi:hypothetical protein